MAQDNPSGGLDRLALQARGGDARAMEALLTACRSRLQRYFGTRTRNAEDCEDLVQETLLRVANALPRTELNAPFDHWLYRIAANCLMTYYSRVYRRQETPFTQFLELESVENLQQDSFEASLLEQIADEQKRELLKQIIKLVCSDAERRVILLHAQHETLDTIAQLLGMNPTTVRTYLLRGRAKVLAYLIQHRPDLLGGAEGIQAAVAELERRGEPLSEAERHALCAPKPNQTHLRRAALKLAKYLRFG